MVGNVLLLLLRVPWLESASLLLLMCEREICKTGRCKLRTLF